MVVVSAWCVGGEAPTRHSHALACPRLSLKVATPEQRIPKIDKIINFDGVNRCEKRRPYELYLVQCGPPFMRLIRTPHGAWRNEQPMNVWAANTRRAASRHCKGARAHGSTIDAMQDMSNPPPPIQLGGGDETCFSIRLRRFPVLEAMRRRVKFFWGLWLMTG